MFAALALAAVLHAAPTPSAPIAEPTSSTVATDPENCPSTPWMTNDRPTMLVCWPWLADDPDYIDPPAMDNDPGWTPEATEEAPAPTTPAPSAAPTTEIPSVPSTVVVDPEPMTYNAADFLEWLRDFLGDLIAALAGH